MREYKFRGYTFRATDITTEAMVNRFGVERKEIRPIYEIDGLKGAMVRPLLTSLSQCRDYIDCVVYAAKRYGKGKDGNAD